MGGGGGGPLPKGTPKWVKTVLKVYLPWALTLGGLIGLGSHAKEIWHFFNPEPPALGVTFAWRDGKTDVEVGPNTLAVERGRSIRVDVDGVDSLEKVFSFYVLRIDGRSRAEILKPELWRRAHYDLVDIGDGPTNTFIVIRAEKDGLSDYRIEKLTVAMNSALARVSGQGGQEGMAPATGEAGTSFTPELPQGRQYIWTGKGPAADWDWEYAGGGKPGGKEITNEKTYKDWADALRGVLRAHLPPDAAIAGRTLRVEERPPD
ncbi:hypothetical protein PHYC_03670 [Phycisphaerales bacterium]|nr:hypothetical protein PHYC_03670 [Phycisphaerales bacterium]